MPSSLSRIPDKMCFGKCFEFYQCSKKKLLDENDIETYSIENERKSVIAERYIRALKNWIYKYTTTISKNSRCIREHIIISKYKNIFSKSLSSYWTE